jgi:hypothetical protein
VKDDTDERNRKSRAPIEGVAGPGEAGKPRPRWGEAPLGLSARSVLSGVTPQSPRPRTATHDTRKTRDARGRAGRNHAGFWVSPQSAQSMGVTSWGRTTREAPVSDGASPYLLPSKRRRTRTGTSTRGRGQEKSRRFFIVLVLVIVLDCFPHRADRGRRRPRARSGKIPPLLYRARPRRRPRLLSSPANRGRGRDKARVIGAIWKGEEVAS